METKEKENYCCCECCHCKKVFMLFVLLLLAFIAGIMVGNCQNYDPSYIYYYQSNRPQGQTNAKNLHRGMHSVKSSVSNQSQSDANAQVGGFVMEVETQN